MYRQGLFEGRVAIVTGGATGIGLAIAEALLTGTFHMCQAAHAKWMRAHGGKIVNIVADVLRGFLGMVHTGAARAGVVNMTKTLVVEWAERGGLINCVAPGTILSTGMHNYPPEVPAAVARIIPLKRLGTVEEVAKWLGASRCRGSQSLRPVLGIEQVLCCLRSQVLLWPRKGSGLLASSKYRDAVCW